MLSDLNQRVRVFFDFMFGNGTIPVKEFEQDQAEMEYLDGGNIYGTMGECQAHGDLSPFIVSLGYHGEQLVWRGTCMDCWAQLRVPATPPEESDDEEWHLDAEESSLHALDPVPSYEEQQIAANENND